MQLLEECCRDSCSDVIKDMMLDSAAEEVLTLVINNTNQTQEGVEGGNSSSVAIGVMLLQRIAAHFYGVMQRYCRQ